MPFISINIALNISICGTFADRLPYKLVTPVAGWFTNTSIHSLYTVYIYRYRCIDV